MKFTTKGIGWLIFGVIVCASSTEAYGIAAKMSTIMLGLVFVLVYFLKQLFVPRGIGWFIAGGILVAFAVEEGLTDDGLLAVGIAAACLMVFYFRNKGQKEYHVTRSESPDDYKAVLAYLKNEDRFYDRNEALHWVADNKEEIKRMTGITF
jgi:hypothetical protein